MHAKKNKGESLTKGDHQQSLTLTFIIISAQKCPLPFSLKLNERTNVCAHTQHNTTQQQQCCRGPLTAQHKAHHKSSNFDNFIEAKLVWSVCCSSFFLIQHSHYIQCSYICISITFHYIRYIAHRAHLCWRNIKPSWRHVHRYSRRYVRTRHLPICF